MQRFHLPRQLLSFMLFACVGGCTLGNTPLAEETKPNASNQEVAKFSSPLSYQLYNLLAAELFLRQSDTQQAALHYTAAAQQSDDPSIARRAMELALEAKDSALSSRALERWIKLAPDSQEALQFSAMNHVQAERYDDAVAELIKIRDNINKANSAKASSKGFDFILALLALEKDKRKAYETLKRYVAQDTTPQTQLALAAFAIKAGAFADSLQITQAVQQKGNKTQRTQAIRLAAEALVEQKNIPEAVAVLEAAYQADPNSDLKLDYARTLILADRRQDAMPLFQQLQAKQPDNLDLAYTLGLLHLEEKAFTRAEPLFKKLQKHEKYADDATYFLGKVYEGLNQPKAAITTYQSIKGGEQLTAATQRIIELISKTKGTEQARQWITQERAATSSEFRQLLLLRAEALWLYDQAQYREAIDIINQALKLRPDNVDLLYSRALNAEKAGDFAAAEADLRALLAKRPDNATVLNALGYMLAVNTDRFAEAEALIRQALQLNTDDAAIMDSLGWVLFRQGKHQEAETWLRKAYETLPDPEIASHLAEVLVANNKKAEAEILLNKMLSEFPNDKVLQKAKAKLAGSS